MMKHPMIADDDDATQEQAPAPLHSSVNGDDFSGDRNEAQRKKNASLEQLEANRRNALQSTGPKTPEGKAHVRLNALKHGILTQQALLPDEDVDAFAELERRLWDEWQPVGVYEEYLVDLILRQMWRLRRAGRAEVAIFTKERSTISLARAEAEVKHHEKSEPAPGSIDACFAADFAPPQIRITDPAKHREALEGVAQATALVQSELATFGSAFTQVVAGADPFSKLSRYETALLRSLDKAFDNLRRLQRERSGNAQPDRSNGHRIEGKRGSGERVE